VEREAVLRLATFLIDKVAAPPSSLLLQGEDPSSYRFTVVGEQMEEREQGRERRRQRLLARIVRLERNYFTSEGPGQALRPVGR
jgi:hypothetical protein